MSSQKTGDNGLYLSVSLDFNSSLRQGLRLNFVELIA